MTRRPNPRAKQQRAVAKRVRESRAKGGKYRPLVPVSIRGPVRQGQIDYANAVLNGEIAYPPKGSIEGNQLARMASLSKYGKADAAFLPAFQAYFYHDKDSEPTGPEFDDEYYDDEGDEDEE